MKPKQTSSSTAAFTLVEMLVVIVIIGLLVAALLPAFGAARRQAQIASCAGMYSGLEQGIQQFQAEQALGGTLPPSTGDNATTRAQRIEIHDPGAETETIIKTSGAQLLAMALIGADGLGTPGFRDLDGTGVWWDDTSKEKPAGGKRGGLYAVDNDKNPIQTRYAGYVDSKMKERMDSFAKLASDGKIVNKTLEQLKADKYAVDQLFFKDPWDAPVLYFRANRAGQRVVPSDTPKVAGVYAQEDNAIITGCKDGVLTLDGLDFGAGKVKAMGGSELNFHGIVSAKSPDPAAITKVKEEFFDNSQWIDTFARFIADPKVLVKPTPSRPDSYLLISAGPDGRYGTEDDVTNWTREKL